jgi:hypothetical protein
VDETYGFISAVQRLRHQGTFVVVVVVVVVFSFLFYMKVHTIATQISLSQLASDTGLLYSAELLVSVFVYLSAWQYVFFCSADCKFHILDPSRSTDECMARSLFDGLWRVGMGRPV